MVDRSRQTAPLAEPGGVKLRAAVIRLLEGCTVDATPRDLAEVERFPAYLPKSTGIFVGQPPGTPIEEVVRLAERLHGLGYRPIPQLAARELVSEVQLKDALARLVRLDITEALIVAGDRPEPAGPFDSTLRLLGTGILADHGVTKIGVAGYPEGNRVIGPTALQQALEEKIDLAAACGWSLYVVTQLSFDAAAVVAWIERSCGGTPRVPVLVGLPGLGTLRDLIGYSQRCGVGASMRALVERASSQPHPASLSTTADLVVAYASAVTSVPALPIAGLRFFTFAGMEATARWIETVRAGHFTLSGSAAKAQLALQPTS